MRGRHVDPLAAVYADALGRVADERGGDALVREVGDALSALGEAWAQSRTLRAYLLSTLVPRAEKRRALARLLEGFPPVMVDFVHLLLRRGRGRIVDKVAVAYEAWLDERLDRVPVVLTTATPVSPDRIQAWTERLRAGLGREPMLRHVVKEDLIAGAVLQVGDRVADGSARRRLAELSQHIRERGKKHALQA